MPTIHWVPLLGVDRPVPVRLLHAAFSSWFDGDGHKDNVKPYTLAPLSKSGHRWGIQIATVTDEAASRVLAMATPGNSVRLGLVTTAVDRPEVLAQQSWSEIAAGGAGQSWLIEFLTPTVFRSGNHASPIPTPGALLRSPTDVWSTFGPDPSPRIVGADHDALWFSRANVRTVDYEINRQHYPGALGSLELRCADPEIAHRVAALLRLAVFCGVGSFRGKGMGIVSVEQT